MRRSSIAVLVTIVVAGLCAALSSASGSPPAPERRTPLDAYTATVSRAAGHANPHITAKLYSHALGSPEEQAERAALAAAAAGLGY